MKPLLLFLLLTAAATLHAQNYIGYSPKQVKKQMQLYMRNHHYQKFTVEESATAITFKLREDSIHQVDFRYEFDPKGKCFATCTHAQCVECIEKTLQAALGHKKYGWIKLNDSTWISSFRHSLQMVLKKNEGEGALSSLDIRKMLWSKRWYEDKLAGRN